MTVVPTVTCPSPAIATAPSRRTQRTVVARMTISSIDRRSYLTEPAPLQKSTVAFDSRNGALPQRVEILRDAKIRLPPRRRAAGNRHRARLRRACGAAAVCDSVLIDGAHAGAGRPHRRDSVPLRKEAEPRRHHRL